MYDDDFSKNGKRDTQGCNNDDPLKVFGRAKGYSKQELLDNISRHANFTPNLIKHIKNIPDVVLRNLGTPMARKIVKMMKEIGKEAYRAKQFTRTEINDRCVLYGIVLLKHRVMDRVLLYFHERWPKCIICLYNEHTQMTGIIDEKGRMREVKKPLKEIVEKISENRPVVPYFEDIQFSGKEIFETLYKTQNIKERENPRYFKQMIPNDCYKLPGMREGIEKRYNNKDKRIDDFI